MKNKKIIIALVIILSFFSFSALAFKNSLSPYVTFAEAKKTKGIVQVRGTLVTDKEITVNGKILTFSVRDDNNEEAIVEFAGVKPEGMEQATSIVVIGTLQQSKFKADKLLVKCPSKYQGSVTR